VRKEVGSEVNWELCRGFFSRNWFAEEEELELWRL